jgi:hypothetical protein
VELFPFVLDCWAAGGFCEEAVWSRVAGAVGHGLVTIYHIVVEFVVFELDLELTPYKGRHLLYRRQRLRGLLLAMREEG